MKSIGIITEYSTKHITEINAHGTGSSVVDFNMGVSKNFFRNYFKAGHQYNNFVNIPKEDYCQDTYKLALSIKDHMNSFGKGGRTTIFRAIRDYFNFVVQHELDYKRSDTLEVYCNNMKAKVHSLAWQESTAIGNLSIINKLFIKLGMFAANFEYVFSNTNSQKKYTNSKYYQPQELSLLMHFVMRLYEVYEKCLIDTLDCIESKKLPKGTLGRVSFCKMAPITLFINDEKHEHMIITKNHVNTYMVLSYILFTYYTLSRKSITTSLKYSQLILTDSGSIDTKPIIKGRGFKFVRFGIGENEFDMDKSGLKWFNSFTCIRPRIINILQSLNFDSQECSDNLFFFVNAKLRRFSKLNSKNYNATVFDLDHIWLVEQLGIVLPRINLQTLIKSAAMILEDESNDPLLLTEKSQHEYETYENSYGRGNPITNLKSMGKALSVIMNGTEVHKSFKERQEEAEKSGFHLKESSDINLSVSANGLGCNQSLPPSPQEKTFLYKMKKRNKDPKQCTDLLNCLECNKCALIDDEDCLYETLSFRQAIMLNKAGYAGSRVGEESYTSLVEKLNEALQFVSPKKLLHAQNRINKEGISPVWHIKI
ncbi:hypothetical protein ACTXIM_16295 [Pseudoalteromonas nigrifaciens]|uniref:hypothetical protein n=1 Tax=Pseudoalteromonas nigrifaciens TaxID=28109 RepID=UPI001865CCF7|nr:hypothetical protein [Pseudoalteromonas nigrifaciens]